MFLKGKCCILCLWQLIKKIIIRLVNNEMFFHTASFLPTRIVVLHTKTNSIHAHGKHYGNLLTARSWINTYIIDAKWKYGSIVIFKRHLFFWNSHCMSVSQVSGREVYMILYQDETILMHRNPRYCLLYLKHCSLSKPDIYNTTQTATDSVGELVCVQRSQVW